MKRYGWQFSIIKKQQLQNGIYSESSIMDAEKNNRTASVDDVNTRKLSENALLPKLFVMPEKISSEYQPYTCGIFSGMPRF